MTDFEIGAYDAATTGRMDLGFKGDGQAYYEGFMSVWL